MTEVETPKLAAGSPHAVCMGKASKDRFTALEPFTHSEIRNGGESGDGGRICVAMGGYCRVVSPSLAHHRREVGCSLLTSSRNPWSV